MDQSMIAKAREGRTNALRALAGRQLILSNVHAIKQRVAATHETSAAPMAWSSVRNVFQHPLHPALLHDTRQNCGT